MLEQEEIKGWVSGLVQVLAPGPVYDTLYSRMGALLGLEIQDESDIAFYVQAGVPSRVYHRVAERLRLPVGYVLSPSRARLARHGPDLRLDPDDGDSLMRIVRLFAQATLMLGDEHAARMWLHSPLRWREGVIKANPLQLAVRESGARLCEQLLQRMVHGVH